MLKSQSRNLKNYIRNFGDDPDVFTFEMFSKGF